MKKLLAIAGLIVISFSSCKKDDPVPTCNLDNNGILGDYKITSILYKSSSTATEVDLFILFDACEKDNILTLAPNGIYNVYEGVTSCSPTSEDNGTWSLSGTNMTLDGTESYAVSNYICSGMTLTQTDTQTGEVTKIALARQ